MWRSPEPTQTSFHALPELSVILDNRGRQRSSAASGADDPKQRGGGGLWSPQAALDGLVGDATKTVSSLLLHKREKHLDNSTVPETGRCSESAIANIDVASVTPGQRRGADPAGKITERWRFDAFNLRLDQKGFESEAGATHTHTHTLRQARYSLHDVYLIHTHTYIQIYVTHDHDFCVARA